MAKYTISLINNWITCKRVENALKTVGGITITLIPMFSEPSFGFYKLEKALTNFEFRTFHSVAVFCLLDRVRNVCLRVIPSV